MRIKLAFDIDHDEQDVARRIMKADDAFSVLYQTGEFLRTLEDEKPLEYFIQLLWDEGIDLNRDWP